MCLRQRCERYYNEEEWAGQSGGGLGGGGLFWIILDQRIIIAMYDES